MQEIQVWSLGWEHPMEKGMAVHSIILSWRIPWAEESGKLQFMGLQKVRHDWATKHTHTHTRTHQRGFHGKEDIQIANKLHQVT